MKVEFTNGIISVEAENYAEERYLWDWMARYENGSIFFKDDRIKSNDVMEEIYGININEKKEYVDNLPDGTANKLTFTNFSL